MSLFKTALVLASFVIQLLVFSQAQGAADECSIPLLSGGFAIDRSLVGYADYQAALLKALPENASLSPREQNLAKLWYAINRPFDLTTVPQFELSGNPVEVHRIQKELQQIQLEEQSISPLKAAIEMLRSSDEQAHPTTDVELLKQMTSSMFQFQETDSAAQAVLVNRVFETGADSIGAKWGQWVSHTDQFISDFESRSVEEAKRAIDLREGNRIASELSQEPGFQELKSVDPDFAGKVLWLKKGSTDLSQFKDAIAHLFKDINLDYRRLLFGSEAIRSQYPAELQPALKNILLRRAYHRTLEKKVIELGLRTINLDELYGVGRVDDAQFSKDIFSEGYVFWDRGFSAHKSSFNPRHGQDLHILQAVIFGAEMDKRFGKGAFSTFYRKIGNPTMGKLEPAAPSRQRRLFYNYGFLSLFDDIYTDVPGNKFHTGIFSVTNPDFSDVMKRMLPLVVD